MKKLLTCLHLLMAFTGFGQPILPASTQLTLMQGGGESTRINSFISAPFDQQDNWPCMAKVDHNFDQNQLPGNIRFGSRIGNIITLRIPKNQSHLIRELHGVTYLELAPKVVPLAEKAVRDSRADSVQMGFGLPQGYTGKDVIIGVTDWGFDYTHPMFYDTALTETRILAAWDQFKRSGPAPAGMNYGTEYDGTTALMAAQSDTACIYYDYATHGSHVAGIAGGSGAGLEHRGVAYDADFLFVAVHLDGASMIDAVNWMKDKAAAEGKRLVVNMSWGLSHIGPLDGTSLLSQALDQFAQDGIVIVTSAGNNGGEEFHIKKTFNSDTMTTRVEFYPYNAHASMWGQGIIMWGAPGHSFGARFEVYDKNDLKIMQSTDYESASSPSTVSNYLVSGSDTVFYELAVDDAHPQNQRPHMNLRIKNTNTSLKVVLRSWANDGIVHYWNVTYLSNGAGNWGMPFSTYGTGSVAGDDEYAIGEPACTKSVITVAAHTSEIRLPNGTIVNGGLATFSSTGPAMDERLKPDISASGVNVASSISSFTTRSYVPITSTNFNGRTYEFARFSGTSMSSPVVSGVVALLLEAAPNLTPEQIKTILINTAREDDKTGVIPATGSTAWGWGKITATAAIEQAILQSSVVDYALAAKGMIYPNPTSELLMIRGLANANYRAEVRAMDGRLVKSENIQDQLNVADLAPGIYLLQLRESESVYTFRFAVQR